MAGFQVGDFVRVECPYSWCHDLTGVVSTCSYYGTLVNFGPGEMRGHNADGKPGTGPFWYVNPKLLKPGGGPW